MEKIDQLRTLVSRTAEFLIKNGIDYWADFGTLLGLYRDDDIIPWDTDADISLEDIWLPYFMHIKDKLERKTGFIVKGSTEVRVVFEESFLDLYFWHFDKDKILGYNINKGFEHFNNRLAVDRNHINELPKVFEWKNKQKILFPSNPEGRLIQLYGKDFMKPDKTINYWSWKNYYARSRNK